MIFSEIVLQNFGVYRGRHEIDLEPSDKQKPIILFGGLNGGGKTTLLEAIQLVLFGNRSNVFTSAGISYSEYLRQSTNRFMDDSEGVSIELTFKRFLDGKDATYRVIRSWENTGKRVIKDEVNVFVNGVFDEVLSAQWDEAVEQFLPSNISSLFFFDGEKVEQLANPDKSSEIIRTGIYSLLGIDSVNSLATNLRTIERRMLRSLTDKESDNAISLIETEVQKLESLLDGLHTDLAHKQTLIDSLKNQIYKLRETYRTHGGDLLARKDQIESDHKHTLIKLEHAAHQMREFFAHGSPLCLVQDLIGSAIEQAKVEQQDKNRDVLFQEIEQRDEKILRELSQKNIDKTTIEALQQTLKDDISYRKAKHAVSDNYLNVPLVSLVHMDAEFFEQLNKEARKLHANYLRALENTEKVERELSSIPEEGALDEISSALKQEKSNLAVAESEYEKLAFEVESYEQKLEAKRVELDRTYYKINEKQLNVHRNKQIISHTNKVQFTLEKFKSELTKKHIHKLETLMEKSFKSLTRKKDLVNKIKIDPHTFRLDVINKQGELIPLSRLSAGERQLVAISVLWGLARASGRPLPVVIDTPLGRLDSQHRTHIVENYFPYASHQVVLLSTDTEIDTNYRELIKPSVGKQYLIQYSSEDRTSKFIQGYFND